jgi:hypothetical protein
MNILYIGHYRENNGLGYSSRRVISSLQNIPDTNLSIRPLFLQNSNLYTSEEIKKLEYIKYDNYDVVIQHTLPDFLEFNRHFGKNIAITEIETKNLSHTGWIEKLNMMDMVWVGSYFSKLSLTESGIRVPVVVVPEPYNRSINFKSDQNNTFKFYTIGNFTDKKNIENILMAFFLEFNKQDDVELILKIKNIKEKYINKLINQIYKILRISPNNRHVPVIINEELNNEHMDNLHRSCDCYLDLARGSSNGSCSIEAMLHGNIAISTDNIGSVSYVNKNNGFIVDSRLIKVKSQPQYGIDNIYTVHESWYDPDMDAMRSAMRQASELSLSDINSKLKAFNTNILTNNNIKRNLL